MLCCVLDEFGMITNNERSLVEAVRGCFSYEGLKLPEYGDAMQQSQCCDSFENAFGYEPDRPFIYPWRKKPFNVTFESDDGKDRSMPIKKHEQWSTIQILVYKVLYNDRPVSLIAPHKLARQIELRKKEWNGLVGKTVTITYNRRDKGYTVTLTGSAP